MSILGEMVQTTHRFRPKVETESSQARPRPIELQTENGFAIIRRCDLDANASKGRTEHCFVVRDTDGYELDITVDFSATAIAEVIHRTFGRVTLESLYWLNCAEHHLSDYLWENNDYPPDGRITIDYLTPDDLDMAQRWGKEDSTPPASLSASFRPTQTSTDGEGSPSTTQPIKFLTENGYAIIRLCDVDASINDSPQACHFRVSDSKGSEHEITVRFNETVIKEIQTRRRRGELLAASKYWLVIAEKYLADYLWRHNQFPPKDELTIDQLSGDDLLLGAHWQEHG